MTNNAYRFGIAAAGLSLFWAGSAQAVAPVISDIPDVVISDSENNGVTDNNYFVFPDAFVFNNFVSDGDTPVNDLKWSFDEGTDVLGNSSTQYFTINNVNPNVVGDTGIATAAGNPASRLNPTNNIRTTSTASFRDVVLSPGTGPLVTPFATAASGVRASHAAGKVVRLYVSDQTFVVSNDILVSAVDNESTPSVDALSGGFSVLKTDAFASQTGWDASGQLAPLLTNAIGSRQYDAGNTALGMTVAASSKYRVIGWLEDPNTDIPYSSIGTKFVRGKFSIFYSGAGDSAVLANANIVPNFRMSLRTKGVVNTVLEVLHNAADGGSIGQLNITREIGPSKNPAAPSVYRVDLDPLDVPFLTGSTTEGVQRAVEVFVTGNGAGAATVGTISLTDSSIGTYPALNLGGAAIKTWATGGTAGSADFDNASINLTRLGISWNTVLRFLGGTNSATDFYDANLFISNLGVNETTMNITRTVNGIVVNTATQPTSRYGAAEASFTGVFGETDATRARIEADKIYVISARISHGAASSSTPSTRFSARSVGFGYNQTFELFGGAGFTGDGAVAAAQVLPGTGNAVPGTTVDGTTYNLIFNSPITASVRADVAGSLATKFPGLLAQPGPGVNSASLRDIGIAFAVQDSLSAADLNNTAAAEVATNLTLNRIQIREFSQIND